MGCKERQRRGEQGSKGGHRKQGGMSTSRGRYEHKKSKISNERLNELKEEKEKKNGDNKIINLYCECIILICIVCNL